jgi:tRNA A-37 threonylcarbamoyl transferase component Bud32
VEKKRRHEAIARQLESTGDHLNAAAGYIALARRGEHAHYASAMENLLRVGRDSPDYVRAQTMLAEILGEQGDVSGGLAVLQRLLQGVTPALVHVPALYQLGRLLEHQGFMAAARDAYTEVAQLKPRYLDVAVRLQQLKVVPESPYAPLAPTSFGERGTAPGPGMILRERYRLEKKIGIGGQADVFLSTDIVLDRPVAIKILKENLTREPAALERFLREARLAARVHHARCIAIYDFGQAGEVTFMAMEYFVGETLREKMKYGPIAPYESLLIALDVANALVAVHREGIVHRDIKPSNIMVGAHRNVKLADFGVAKHVDGEPTSSGMMIGSMGYMAPEQASGRQSDPRADIYALGIVLFEMLAGAPPFPATLEALANRIHQPPPELPEKVNVPKIVRDAVMKAMQPKRDARYASIEDMIRDLEIAKTELEKDPSISIDIIESSTDIISSADVEPISTNDVV